MALQRGKATLLMVFVCLIMRSKRVRGSSLATTTQVLPHASEVSGIPIAVDVYNAGAADAAATASPSGCCTGPAGGPCEHTLPLPLPASASDTVPPGSVRRLRFTAASTDVPAGHTLRCDFGVDAGAAPQAARLEVSAAALSALSIPPAPPLPDVLRAEVWHPVDWGGAAAPQASAACLEAFGTLRSVFNATSGRCEADPALLVAAPTHTPAPPTDAAQADTPEPSAAAPDTMSPLPDVLPHLMAALPEIMQEPSCGHNASWDGETQRCTGCPTEACSLPGCACNAQEAPSTATLGADCTQGSFDFETQSCLCDAGWRSTADAPRSHIFCSLREGSRTSVIIVREPSDRLSHNPATALRQLWAVHPGLCLLVLFFFAALIAVVAVGLTAPLRLHFTRAIHNSMHLAGALDDDTWRTLDAETQRALDKHNPDAKSPDDMLDGTLPGWLDALLAPLPPSWSLEAYRAELAVERDLLFAPAGGATEAALQSSVASSGLNNSASLGSEGAFSAPEGAVPNPLSCSLFSAPINTVDTAGTAPPTQTHPDEANHPTLRTVP